MLSLISSSLAGLYDSTSRAAEAAQRILKATGQASAALDADSWQAGSRAYGGATGPDRPQNGGGRPVRQPFLSSGPSDADLIHSMVDLQLAAHAYKASATVMKTAGEMTDALLDIQK